MSSDPRRDPDPEHDSAKFEPPLRLARSIDDVAPGVLVAIDRHGGVRSPARYRATQLAYYGAFATVATVGLYVYTLILGPVGAAIVGLWTAYVLRAVVTVRQMNRVSTLISLERIDEAELLLDRLSKRRFLGAMYRAQFARLRGAALARRGQHSAALVALREAITMYRQAFRRGLAFPWMRTCEYAEVVCLCEIGQVREAKERFEQIEAGREGEVLRVGRWTAELTLAFANGAPSLDRDALFERAQQGLRMTVSAQLLALCAWGYVKLGDDDMAEHLLREAFERNENARVEAFSPSLWRWMNEQRNRFDTKRDDAEVGFESKASARA